MGSGTNSDPSKDSFNKSGFAIFGIAFVAVTILYFVVSLRNPGPIDSKWPTVAAKGISHDQIVSRENEFRKSTPEAIEKGKELYAVNCAGCHSHDPALAGEDGILKRLKANQATLGTKETDLYRVIFRGIPTWGDRLLQKMPRQDFITDPNRWALVHYMRSLIPDAPKANASDWKALDDEKIW